MGTTYIEVQTVEGKRQVPLGDEPVSIGRHPQNTVVITDPLSSRRHCVIERAKAGWQVRDLNSSNGTRINGSVISQSRLLPGDIIGIGATRIVLVAPGASPRGADAGDAEEISEADLVPEDDAVVELSEADVVEEEDDGHAQAAEGHYRYDDDAPLKVDAFDEPAQTAPPIPAAPSADAADPASDQSFLQSMGELADSLPNRPFGPYDIAVLNARGQVVHPASTPSPGKSKQEAVELMRLLLLVVTRSRATDIHMEPKGEYVQLRVRIDGSMVDVVRLPNEMGVKLTALVKVLCDIDMTQKSIVQEGHFASRVPGRRIDYRVSFAPSVFGQKLVVRVLDTALAPLKITDLDLPAWMLREVAETIQQDQGMVLVCGPTGSGKTTTLYALIRSSDTSTKNFVTIEDPVEIQIDGVTQIPVDEGEGKTFSALLRSVLRQDPDAILVGEIRDPETARIAMQAAITGHMVFSTVHTMHTAGTIFRLLDLGVEPYLIAQGLHLVLAQRLVRQLCPACKRAIKPSPEQLARLPRNGEGVQKIYAAVGCPRCLSTGFSGRRAFFELLRTSDELREVINRSPTMAEIQKVLAVGQFERLQQTGFQLVADGVTTFEEIERTVGR